MLIKMGSTFGKSKVFVSSVPLTGISVESKGETILTLEVDMKLWCTSAFLTYNNLVTEIIKSGRGQCDKGQ